MAWLIVAAIAVFSLSPLAGLLTQLTWVNFLGSLRDETFLKSLYATLVSSVGGALFSVVVGIAFARQFALHDWRFKRQQRLALLLPYLIPNFILAMTYVVAWNPTTGLLNNFVRFPLGLYGLTGMTILFAVANMPVAFLLIEEKIRRIDPSFHEAARLSGATTWESFSKVELPLLVPTIMSAFGLCFALNISAFAIPAWIGAPEHVYPLTYKIYQAIQLGGVDGLSDAANLAVILFALALIPFAGGFFLQGSDRKYVLLSGKSSKNRSEEQRPRDFYVFQGLFWISQILFWIAPLVCLFLSTLVRPGCLQERGLECLREFTLVHYKYVIFDLNETQLALKGSLVYGGLAAFLIVVFAIGALSLLAGRTSTLRLSELILTVPLATPGAIIALGVIVVYSGRFGVNLYNTAWIAVVAYMIKHASLAFSPLRTGYANISGSLLEAARLSGGNRWQIWERIVLPILQPEWLGGFFLVFVPIVGELTMSVFLASPSFRSIGTVLFDLQDYADQASASALAFLLIVMILAFNELSRNLSRGKLGY